LGERRAGDALKFDCSANKVLAEKLSYSRHPLLQGSFKMWSQTPETEERDLVTANDRGVIVPHEVISELDIRGLERGCSNPHEPCGP